MNLTKGLKEGMLYKIPEQTVQAANTHRHLHSTKMSAPNVSLPGERGGRQGGPECAGMGPANSF